ncbi:membrane-bound lytic murein transglycosylase B [Methyloglobulus morosus KoM1]|uniref:Membrane-bound lytic murein transglycosylase B n=1 Tax=Methyloglobulus morosus KoM1 TaxID=1116472 RepID=V5C561_9GAMM|nr:membrane-bound lytic murein transglycosylase B [Methyloglobulus morosus KoM1]
MKIKNYFLRLFISCACFVILSCANPVKNQETVDGFIKQMASRHQFNEAALTDLFDHVELKDDIIKKISKPSESLPWYKYREIFLKTPRIKAGVQFWQENEQILATIEQETGVPAAIIVAIIGVETMYGKHTGNYRVIDALATLAFDYPPRSQFFRNELEEFLLLCREEHIDPLTPLGSYAGALGMPQFMPSSYRNYAIDYNKDNSRDIWHNSQDVIASIANYFVKHGWQAGQPVAFRLCDKCHKTVNTFPFLKEDLSLIKSNAINPNISRPLLSIKKAKIIAFKQEDGEELWAALDNFYVITRYNHSPLYAMAVFQLGLAISNQRISSLYEKDHNLTSHAGT